MLSETGSIAWSSLDLGSRPWSSLESYFMYYYALLGTMKKFIIFLLNRNSGELFISSVTLDHVQWSS